jgi:hypothetical protein
MALLVAQIVYGQKVGWLVNNALEIMWMEAVVIYFKVLAR